MFPLLINAIKLCFIKSIKMYMYRKYKCSKQQPFCQGSGVLRSKQNIICFHDIILAAMQGRVFVEARVHSFALLLSDGLHL